MGDRPPRTTGIDLGGLSVYLVRRPLQSGQTGILAPCIPPGRSVGTITDPSPLHVGQGCGGGSLIDNNHAEHGWPCPLHEPLPKYLQRHPGRTIGVKLP